MKIRTAVAAALAGAAIGAAAAPAAAATPAQVIAGQKVVIAKQKATIAKRTATLLALRAEAATLKVQLAAANAKLADVPGQIRTLTPDDAWSLLSVIGGRLQGVAPYTAGRAVLPQLGGGFNTIWAFSDGGLINPTFLAPPPAG